jgi:hypothetical protein
VTQAVECLLCRSPEFKLQFHQKIEGMTEGRQGGRNGQREGGERERKRKREEKKGLLEDGKEGRESGLQLTRIQWAVGFGAGQEQI